MLQICRLNQRFPKGKNTRIIYSSDPVNTSINFFELIANGGKLSELPNGKGTMARLSDGTTIVHRIITSTPGSPAVEITVSASNAVKNQKIHFLRK